MRKLNSKIMNIPHAVHLYLQYLSMDAYGKNTNKAKIYMRNVSKIHVESLYHSCYFSLSLKVFQGFKTT